MHHRDNFFWWTRYMYAWHSLVRTLEIYSAQQTAKYIANNIYPDNKLGTRLCLLTPPHRHVEDTQNTKTHNRIFIKYSGITWGPQKYGVSSRQESTAPRHDILPQKAKGSASIDRGAPPTKKTHVRVHTKLFRGNDYTDEYSDLEAETERGTSFSLRST